MAPRRRAPRRKRAARKGGKRAGKKSRVPRGITATQQQFCKVTETVAFQDILPGVQAPDSFNLMAFTRARYMANGFQFYKAAKCTWTYYPLYNTFATDAAVQGDTVPYIYTTMNRTGDSALPNNLQAFQAMGAKPVKFIKKHVVSYVPNWVTPGLPVKLTGSSGNTIELMMGSRPCYDWINNTSLRAVLNSGIPAQNLTSQLIPNTPQDLANHIGGAAAYALSAPTSACYEVIYNGHNTIFDQFVTSGELRPIGRLTLTVEWHFKCPIWDSRISQNINLNSEES